VTNDAKLRAIRRVLSVHDAPSPDAPGPDAAGGGAGPQPQAPGDAHAHEEVTVFELAGTDRIGLLTDVIQLLKNNGCDVRSAAVWTYHTRVAFVISVSDELSGSAPIRDGIKLARLRQLLQHMMDAEGNSIANCRLTKGLIHYERRLHQVGRGTTRPGRAGAGRRPSPTHPTSSHMHAPTHAHRQTGTHLGRRRRRLPAQHSAAQACMWARSEAYRILAV
jgi:hypothetical protein